MVAYTEEQSNELAYAALCEILRHGPLCDDFDIGLERIERIKGGRGKAVSIAGSPSATDGARTTFQLFDETHHMTMPRQRQAQQTMLANMMKRPRADPWTLETTTASEPGTGSIAEATMDYGKAVIGGTVDDRSLFFFHRQASDKHDLTTVPGRRAAVIEASGPAAVWRDIDRIVARWEDPTSDKRFLERVWLNRMVQSSSQAFDVEAWNALAADVSPVKDGDLIVLGFDGAMFHDSTALVATHVATGYQWTVRLWERPINVVEWKVPAEEVDATVQECFTRFNVWRLYADPPYWETWVSKWVGLYGKDRVHEWYTNRIRQMAFAIRAFVNAIKEGALTHAPAQATARHIGNSRRDDRGGSLRDDEGKTLFVIKKDRPDSPFKIDAAMASILSWEARNDAIAAGATKQPEFQMFFAGGPS